MRLDWTKGRLSSARLVSSTSRDPGSFYCGEVAAKGEVPRCATPSGVDYSRVLAFATTVRKGLE